MIKTIFAALGILFTSIVVGQSSNNEKLIELAKAYKDFMFRNEPPKEVYRELKGSIPENMSITADFILQTITTKNKLLSQQFLARPDDQSLKQIFIIRAIDLNLRGETRVDNNTLIDSLNNATIPIYELVDNYYGMLFTAVGNKNQPFDFSKVNFKLKDYKLKDETEEGIFFLKCMRGCNSVIWGYMNVVKPPNTEKAYELIKKYPRFNGQPYYQFTNFYYSDFEMNIIKGEGKQSYKGYYLDKYFEILLYHLICLNKEGGNEKEKNDLLLGSVLKERNLYQYTKYKETLEEIFKEQK